MFQAIITSNHSPRIWIQGREWILDRLTLNPDIS